MVDRYNTNGTLLSVNWLYLPSYEVNTDLVYILNCRLVSFYVIIEILLHNATSGGGGGVIGISGYLIWSKTLMELIFNPCGEFR